MRVDTTVVESNIHYPSGGSLLGDRARVSTHSMHRRSGRSCVKWRVLEVAPAAHCNAAPSRDRLKAAYGSLLQATNRVLG